jgi:hypothetical protein
MTTISKTHDRLPNPAAAATDHDPPLSPILYRPLPRTSRFFNNADERPRGIVRP